MEAGFSVRVESSPEQTVARDGRFDSVRISGLGVQWATLDDGRCVVSVVGEVDVHTAPRLAETLDRARAGGTEAVIADLKACSFIDSSGLKVLVDASTRLRQSERRLELVASDGVLRALELTGLDSVFTIHRSLAMALIPPKEGWADEAKRRVHTREANEQLEESCARLGSGGADEFAFICECGDRACTSLLHIGLAEYESVRAHPARFVIARNHENPEVERVVHENGRFAIVETVTGELSKPALESNPRWQRGEPW